jgi:uncharacterized protein YbjT (DUF2867 family)
MGEGRTQGRVLVTGATGFVGEALLATLLTEGLVVRATTRGKRPGLDPRAEWVEADLSRAGDLARALEGVRAAYFLVHGMAEGREDYAAQERRVAASFAEEAARAGLERVVYLGGVAPAGPPSPHLASRLEVGEVLRAGRVPTLELRASMIVGARSASWRIVRDLALRLPAMVLPAWARSRTCPIGIEDMVAALVAAPHVPLAGSAWFDVPGPEVLPVGEILARVAALRGRRLVSIRAPVGAPRVSSLWLKLVSDAEWTVARELVLGLLSDLLPADDRYWALAGLPPRMSFDEAARRALLADPPPAGFRGRLMALEESLVDRFSPRRS